MSNSEMLAMLEEQCSRLIQERAGDEHRKRLLESAGSFDKDLWEKAAELGWPAAAVAEEAGGLGLGFAALTRLCETLGSRTVSLPLIECAVIADAAACEEAQEAVAALSAGEAIGCIAFGEPGENGVPIRPDVMIGEAGITGTKVAVPYGAVADYALCLAHEKNGEADDSLALVLVDLRGPGVERTVKTVIDNARAMADLHFTDAQVVRLANGDSRQKAMRAMAIAALATSFAQIGGARTCLNLSVEFAKERVVFGQKIGRFQAIKHKLSDMYAAIEIAHGCAIDTLDALENGGSDFLTLAAMARLGAINAYDFAAREAVQTLGGIGVTWEAEPQHHYRRSRSLALELGSAFYWRDLVIDRQSESAGDAESSTGGGPAEGEGQNIDDYRLQAREWLAQNAPEFCGENRGPIGSEKDIALGRAWQARKSANGFASVNLPRELGGGGRTELEKIIFGEEELRYNLPNLYFEVSLGMPVPMMIRYAAPEVRDRLVPRAIRGDDIWCQLFSEPAAGSDLAALRMRAQPEIRDGISGWVLSGQKVWTSWAQFADWGIVIARSDPSVAKHAGLTFFYLDMNSPGVEVRPIRRMAGATEINEVFFNDVFVPDSQRMGPVGGGFGVAIETLMIERYSVTDEALRGPTLEKFMRLARRSTISGRPAIEDGAIRALVADALVERQGLRSIQRRALEAIGEGREPGPEGAIRKLLTARRRQEMGAVAMDLVGPDATILADDGDTVDDFTWSWIEAPGGRIAGGTDEILRNTIAEKVLGLPQDHRPDKGIPFNQAIQ